MKFKVGDRIVLKYNTHFSGVVLGISYTVINKFETLKVRWDHWADDRLMSNNHEWVSPSDVQFEKQVMRNNKLNQLGI